MLSAVCFCNHTVKAISALRIVMLGHDLAAAVLAERFRGIKVSGFTLVRAECRLNPFWMVLDAFLPGALRTGKGVHPTTQAFLLRILFLNFIK